MPQSYPIATPISWLASPTKDDAFDREYADRQVYKLDDRPGLFRRVPARARRTMEVANEGAILASFIYKGKPQFIEVVEFTALKELLRDMRKSPPRGEGLESVIIDEAAEVNDGEFTEVTSGNSSTCPTEEAASKGTAMDDLPDMPPVPAAASEEADDKPPY